MTITSVVTTTMRREVFEFLDNLHATKMHESAKCIEDEFGFNHLTSLDLFHDWQERIAK